MMLAAPELVIAKCIELLDQIEVTTELQHRVLADRMMRGEKSSEFEAGHGRSLVCGLPSYGVEGAKGSIKSIHFSGRAKGPKRALLPNLHVLTVPLREPFVSASRLGCI